MISAKIETYNFTFTVFANNEAEAKVLLREAWKAHLKEYECEEDHGAEYWEELLKDLQVTEIICGAVLRDGTEDPIYRDPVAYQHVRVAVISHKHGHNVYTGDPHDDSVEELLIRYVREWWYRLEEAGEPDIPAIETVPVEDIVKTFFEFANEILYEYLLVDDVYPVVQAFECPPEDCSDSEEDSNEPEPG